MYYHASQTPDIKTLEPKISNHGIPLIYFSTKRENVLVYLSNAIEKGKWQKWGPYGFSENGILRLEEYYPNALESTYKGVSGYIYSTAAIVEADFEVRIPYAACSSNPVDVESIEFVPDAYEAILEVEAKGLITIMRYEEMPDRMKEWNIRTVREEYENAVDHPEYRHFLRGVFPDIFKEDA